MTKPFIPRAVFPTLDSLPRSYFLGHHRAGLTRMKSLISQIDLVIECRDYRIPLSSLNPLFEDIVTGKGRMVVYTKRDLAYDGSKGGRRELQTENLLKTFNQPAVSLFATLNNDVPRSVSQSTNLILDAIRKKAIEKDSLMSYKVMVIGMPNIGKSTLLNAFRNVGMKKAKVAKTGAQPGVTRSIGTTVKILEGTEGSNAGVYILDTPGVFVPYVPDAEAMLKLSLCGCVKDTVIPPTILADYLLFHLNLREPGLYAEYSQPTNEVDELLYAVGKKTGRLQKGGVTDVEAAALWLVQRWRTGHLGHFILDDVNEDDLQYSQKSREVMGTSMSQGRRAEKDFRRECSKKSLSIIAG